ncbi:MAG: hypothetical protein M0R17_07085 [Candidatus Omnitrophica bacterium]|jgi:hypothetical protein|nr:hypothetical protein [Candidatus Omnitrophota bacterium]
MGDLELLQDKLKKTGKQLNEISQKVTNSMLIAVANGKFSELSREERQILQEYERLLNRYNALERSIKNYGWH